MRALLMLVTFFLPLATPRASEPAPAHRWWAARDFTPVTAGDFVPPYAEIKDADRSAHGLAINTVRHEGRAAAAEAVFTGRAGTYRLELLAVAEEDGESEYRLAVNGRELPSRTNPPVTEKRVPVRHRWSGVTLAPGDRVRVIFAGRSNGRIPEGAGFAWARGRWRWLAAWPEAPAAQPPAGGAAGR
jgi:hypothetical protein